MRALLLTAALAAHVLAPASAQTPAAGGSQGPDDIEFAVHYPAGAEAYITTNIGATRDAGMGANYEDPACLETLNDGDNSVWFVFSVTNFSATTGFSVDTEGSDFDTMLALYANTSTLGCNDDHPGSGVTSRVEIGNVPTGARTTYLARVTGFGGAEGIVRIRVTLGSDLELDPVNDLYTETPWTTLATSGVPHYGDNENAAEFNQMAWEVPATCTGLDRNNAVFWRFVAPSAGTLTLSTAGSQRRDGGPLDTILSLYPASGPGALTEVACNDDGSGNGASQITEFPVTAGTTYAVRVSTYDNANGGVGSLVLTPTFAPGTAGEADAAAAGVYLDAPAPNPARGRTALAFTLARASEARLTVVDLLGREVAVLFDGPAAAGRTDATFDASRLPAGVYVARLAAAGMATTTRVTVVR